MKEGMNVSIRTCSTINRSLTQGSTSIRKLIQWQMVGADAYTSGLYYFAYTSGELQICAVCLGP